MLKGNPLDTTNTKSIRNIIKSTNQEEHIINQFKWPQIELNNEKHDIYKLASTVTKETKLIVIQWKILHKIFPTNEYLHTTKVVESNTCTYCGHLDSIQHYFIECNRIKSIWNEVRSDINMITGKRIELNEDQIIFGLYKRGIISIYSLHQKVNHIILIAKHAIIKHKYQKSNLIQLYNHEKSMRNIQIT